MPTPWLSKDLRKRIVAHYEGTEGATYESTAETFQVGRASVSRILRLYRETGNLMPAPKPKKPKNKIDLEWLRAHALAHPDARLKDRAADFLAARGVAVSITSVHHGMRAIGFTHKKRPSMRRSVTPSASPNSEKTLSRNSPR